MTSTRSSTADLANLRIAFVQYGDFATAEAALAGGAREEYHAQRYSVEYIQGLVERGAEVTVINLSEQTAPRTLASGIRHIGIKDGYRLSRADWAHLLQSCNPNRIVLRTPLRQVLSFAHHRQIRCLVTLADSFQGIGLGSWIQRKRLTTLFNQDAIEFIGNHGINATKQLCEMGVRPEKVVPWDWPYSGHPSDFAPKRLPEGQPLQLLYVGSVTHEKGVFDLLNAASLLHRQGFAFSLDIIGNGHLDQARASAEAHHLADQVHILGAQSHDQVLTAMRAADAVIVPSQHRYPEGFPLTIYEALSVRTPLVLSDHPMFVGLLHDGEDALFARQRSASSFASAIRKLCDPDLYARMSGASLEAWERLQIPTKWADLVDCWLADNAMQIRKWSLAESTQF